MATRTEAISATTAADSSVTFNINAGSTVTFCARGLSGVEAIVIEEGNATDGYVPLTFVGSDGSKVSPRLTVGALTCSVSGPLQGRLNKPVTTNQVKVVQYS